MLRSSLLLLALASFCLAADKVVPAPADTTNADYVAKIENRTNDILASLELKDAAKVKAVHDIIFNQYIALQNWQSGNEAKVSALKKESHAPDKALAEKAATGLAEVMATRKALRTAYLESLSKHLSPEQVELVKDKMTYFKVRVTFNAYCQQNPTLNDEQKAKILGWLKEAREEAIDGGSADEKSDIFNKYKGRINNFLVKEGVAKKKS